MITLSSTTQSLEIVLSGSDGALHWAFAWVDWTPSSATPDSNEGVMTTIGTLTTVAAPSSGFRRLIKAASLVNRDPTPCTVRVQKDDSSSEAHLHGEVTLRENDGLFYEDGGRGWYVSRASDGEDYSGRSVAFFKVGTAADTVGYFYCHSKDSGFPGAWAPGTPGLGGRTTDGTTSADAGCLIVPNAATGGNFLTAFELSSTVAQFYSLIDVLWCNSGTVVTTTTGQTVNSGTLPARDANGTTDGEGCVIGLLFTSASTNAAVISNSTVTYTNSDGTGGRTAKLANLVGAQIPVSPTVGTIVWFQLAVGDKGVRSIQTLTLGTSLVTGAVSLLIARQVATYSSVVANVGNGPRQPMEPGIRLFDGSCLLLCYQAAATTATTVAGSITVQERPL